jgi:hypothetical protein
LTEGRPGQREAIDALAAQPGSDGGGHLCPDGGGAD